MYKALEIFTRLQKLFIPFHYYQKAFSAAVGTVERKLKLLLFKLFLNHFLTFQRHQQFSQCSCIHLLLSEALILFEPCRYHGEPKRRSEIRWWIMKDYDKQFVHSKSQVSKSVIEDNFQLIDSAIIRLRQSHTYFQCKFYSIRFLDAFDDLSVYA